MGGIENLRERPLHYQEDGPAGFCQVSQARDPSLGFCKFRPGDRLVAAATFHVGELWGGWEGNTMNMRNIGAGKVQGDSEDVGGAIM